MKKWVSAVCLLLAGCVAPPQVCEVTPAHLQLLTDCQGFVIKSLTRANDLESVIRACTKRVQELDEDNQRLKNQY